PVPEAGKEAAIRAVRENRSKYTPVAGIPELRAIIAARTSAQQPTVPAWKNSQVIVTNGGKQALFNAFMALLDPGDEVLIPAPYWLSYPEMVKIAGGTPVVLPTTLEGGFKITPAQLKSALTPRTKILVLNSPSNPTGAMYSKAELTALGDVVAKAPGVWVISDEIYDQITYGDPAFCSFLQSSPGLRDRVITVNGLSKSGAMTGWRVGWSVAPDAVTSAMSTLQGQCTSGIHAPAQWAALAVLGLPPQELEEHAAIYLRRRDLVLEILRKSRKIEVFTPQGAFYVFVGVKHGLKSGEDSIGFAERLLEQAKVAVVPGTPFGAPEFLRLSFASDEKTLTEGCNRIVKFLA
ncbi:MAG: pyridoxal phosphate-dependent aminotransferase, partial [Bdellovibrionota bacterium]